MNRIRKNVINDQNIIVFSKIQKEQIAISRID